MRSIYAYSISILSFLIISGDQIQGQDTIIFPLRINAGIEVSGPVIYHFGKKISNNEGYISADINEKTSVVLGGGYTIFNYSQYNYEYLNEGYFLKTGADFNLLKPDKAAGRFWLGIGLRYGFSRSRPEVPSFSSSNYWGTTTSSIVRNTDIAHFFEFSPGVRTEVIRNLSIGWTLSFRMLLNNTSDNDLQPIYIPGFGKSATKFNTGVSYFIVWNIPYKKKRVIIQKEEPEETDDTGTTGTGQQIIVQ
jgi:hypothetical protein